MKTTLLAGLTAALLLGAASAQAADAIYMDGPGVVTVDGNDWTGFHIGVRGALGASNTDFSILNGGTSFADIDITGNGALLGIGAGYDYDLGGFVLGIDGDISWSNIHTGADIVIPGPGGGSINASTDLEYLATLEARVGADMGGFLPYVHGGLAWGRTSQTATQTPSGGPTTPIVPGLGSQDRFGYTLGAGVEFMVTDQVSFRTEYGYTNLGDEQILDLGGGTTVNETLDFHTITAGVSFHF